MIVVLFSASCKKELYDNSLVPPSKKDPFLTELYNNLLKNDTRYHILDQLQPADKLGWERMMVRYKSGKTASFNYVLPIIRQGMPTDRLIQFSFSGDKLANISLLSYNNNLRPPIASDSLNSSYVKNQQAGNILACMSKNGLVVSDKLAKSAASVSSLDKGKIAAAKNPMQAKPQTLMSLPSTVAAKPMGTNTNVMTINDGSGCSTTVDFEFLYTYSMDYGSYLHTYSNNSYSQSQNLYQFNANASRDFDKYFNEYLRMYGFDYEDNSGPNNNQIIFYGIGPQISSMISNYVQFALSYAADQTSMSQHFDESTINYFIPTIHTYCGMSGVGGSGGSEPPYTDESQTEGTVDVDGERDPDFPSNCQSWAYTPASIGTYQTCGVTDLRFDWIATHQGADATIYINYVQLKFGKTIYFEFPRTRVDGEVISPGLAAMLSATAKDAAEEILESQIESSPPPTSGLQTEQLLNRFLNILKTEISYYGGRVTYQNNYQTPATAVRPYTKTVGGGGCY